MTNLTNARPEPVEVEIVQAGLWGDVRVIAQSLKGSRRSADEVQWTVTVPANGSAQLTTTFETRW
jgi:hypothetical protein